MLNWFNDLLNNQNIQWVFSGIGVVIIVAIVSAIWRAVRHRRDNASPPVQKNTSSQSNGVIPQTETHHRSETQEISIGDVKDGIHNPVIVGGDAHIHGDQVQDNKISAQEIHIGDNVIKLVTDTDVADRQSVSPFMVPSLPIQRVWGRDDILTKTYQKLQLDNQNAEDVQPIALQGMGGIGKTTLATAFGRLDSILGHFPDGVLWVTVGPEPTVRTLLDDWGRMLDIDLLAERDEDACRERLRAVLHHRRVLLIIDDVWEIVHGQYFSVAGPKCRTLLTTRETPIAYELASRERTIRVDVLKPEHSLALLGSLVPEIVAADERNSMRLCERLEFLPLALTLAGRFLANEADVPSRMQRLLDELIERKEARLNLIQAEMRSGLDERTPSLKAILGMSVDRLGKTDQERFAMLSKFGAEPLTWQVDAVTYVWECSKEEAETTISRLIQRGLVVPRSNQEYWMHALLADYATEMSEEMNL